MTRAEYDVKIRAYELIAQLIDDRAESRTCSFEPELRAIEAAFRAAAAALVEGRDALPGVAP